MLLFAIAGKAKLDFLYGSVTIYVKVQDGGKMRAKTGVKLAYKHDFALIFTSDGHPMLLVRPLAGQED